MVKHIFCIKDELCGYMSLILEVNSDIAIRQFKASLTTLLCDDNATAPVEDYNLYELGTFNLVSGHIESHEPRIICTGISVVRNYIDSKLLEIDEANSLVKDGD